MNYELKITNYELRVKNYELRTAKPSPHAIILLSIIISNLTLKHSLPLQDTNYQLSIVNYQLSIINYQLSTVNY